MATTPARVAVADLLRSNRYLYANERELSDALAAAPEAAGMPAEREVRLSAVTASTCLSDPSASR